MMEVGGRVEEARTVGMVGVVGTVGVVGMVGVAVVVGSHHLGAASTGPAVRLGCARRGEGTTIASQALSVHYHM